VYQLELKSIEEEQDEILKPVLEVDDGDDEKYSFLNTPYINQTSVTVINHSLDDKCNPSNNLEMESKRKKEETEEDVVEKDKEKDKTKEKEVEKERSRPPPKSKRMKMEEPDDEFILYESLPSTKKKEKQKEEKKELEDRNNMVKKYKVELTPIIPILRDIASGKIESKRAKTFDKGGKDRHSMKWNLKTGGFSDQEFEVIMEILKEEFPDKNLQYVIDVLWEEAAMELIKRNQKIKDNPENILNGVEYSDKDLEDLRRIRYIPCLEEQQTEIDKIMP